MKRTLILLSLLLPACATQPDYMASWVGRPSDDLLAKWGAPDSRFAMDNGKQVWTWIDRRIVKDHNGPDVQNCRRSFVIANGEVEKWSRIDCREAAIQLGVHPLAPD